jgi:hypothetical protein
MGDLIFNGGKIGMWLGNQQFTVRNVSISDASTAIFAMWNWGWTFQVRPVFVPFYRTPQAEHGRRA